MWRAPTETPPRTHLDDDGLRDRRTETRGIVSFDWSSGVHYSNILSFPMRPRLNPRKSRLQKESMHKNPHAKEGSRSGGWGTAATSLLVDKPNPSTRGGAFTRERHIANNLINSQHDSKPKRRRLGSKPSIDKTNLHVSLRSRSLVQPDTSRRVRRSTSCSKNINTKSVSGPPALQLPSPIGNLAPRIPYLPQPIQASR